jgi:hypothetical protein
MIDNEEQLDEISRNLREKESTASIARLERRRTVRMTTANQNDRTLRGERHE